MSSQDAIFEKIDCPSGVVVHCEMRDDQLHAVVVELPSFLPGGLKVINPSLKAKFDELRPTLSAMGKANAAKRKAAKSYAGPYEKKQHAAAATGAARKIGSVWVPCSPPSGTVSPIDHSDVEPLTDDYCPSAVSRHDPVPDAKECDASKPMTLEARMNRLRRAPTYHA